MSGLQGRRAVVVGASSGIGRGVALGLAAAGAEVVVAARRLERLDELVAEAPNATSVSLDLRSATSRDEFCATVRHRFAEVDVLFVTAGAAPLRAFTDTDDDDWLHALETNVIGIQRVVAGLVDVLANDSLTLVMSSEAALHPRSHLGAYGASKAALEHTVEQWREEYPYLRFGTVNLGGTIPTEFGTDFGHEELTDALESWGKAGRSQASFMMTDEVCAYLCDTIVSLADKPSIDVRSLVLRSPSPPEDDVDALLDAVRASGMT